LTLRIQNEFPLSKIVVFDKFNDLTELSNGNKKFLGTFRNLCGYTGQTICGDIASESDVMSLLEFNFDIIFHLAAISDTQVINENEVFSNNLSSFRHIIKLAKNSNARLVYASSAAVYGLTQKQSLDIGDESPVNAYAFSKYSMDCIARKLIDNDELNVIGLRYFNVYGPGEENKYKTASTIYQFAMQMLSNVRPKLFQGSESFLRDFVYIEDVVNCTLTAGFSSTSGIFNVGSSQPRSFYEVYQILKDKLNIDLDCEFIENLNTESYQKYTCANMIRTEKCLSFKPIFTLEDGIEKYMLELKRIGNG
jgi:ADP-L-glycero-D-manno-heptose 6-epimerase